MLCCGNHNHDDQKHENLAQGNETHRTHKHNHHLMMASCLIIPIVVIAGLFLTDGFSGKGNLLILAAVLVCPLMHLFMMPGMLKKSNTNRH